MTSISRRLSTALVVLAVAVALSSCGEDEPTEVRLGGAQASGKTLDRPWGKVKAFPQLKKAEAPAAADTTFATEMVMHHEQAVELSQNLLTHADVEERIKATARFITQDQSNEISIMSAWLTAWEKSLGSEGHEHHGEHDDAAPMPGMLPQAQVDEVKTLDTPAAQIHFLRSMVTHHEGAITMSQDYLPHRTNSFTFSTAQHIIREQAVEIEYMNNLIDELCAADPVDTCPAP